MCRIRKDVHVKETGNKQCFLKPRLHDTTGCQSGCQTGLTTGCIVYTNIQPVVKTGCQNRLTTGLTTGCMVYTAG